MLIELMNGKILSYSLTTYFKADKVMFTPENKCPIQLDGDVYQNHAFEATLCTGLKFY